MRFQVGEIRAPMPTSYWIADPSGSRSPRPVAKSEWPAIVLDESFREGTNYLGTYLFVRILLASGEIIEVYPSFLLDLCYKVM